MDERAAVEELRLLLARGRITGTVTVDEVLSTLGSPEPTPGFVEAITELLGSQGIAVDPDEPVEGPVDPAPPPP
ncbi:MAG: RNA polymerase sigma factor region1.1 domain-containing protein, partial [Acidimicrobiales bacterium]